MKQFLLFLVAASLLAPSFSQNYTTPNTGVKWTPDSLVANAPAFVTMTPGTYTLHDSLTIARNDTFLIDQSCIFSIDSGILVTVFGTLITDANIQITATDITKPYRGFRFEDSSAASFRATLIEYGGGLRVLTENFRMDSCLLQFNVAGVSTGSAISFSRGKPVIVNSAFISNELPAVSSGANQEVALDFRNNYLEKNNTGNSNRPQVNMGPSGTDTTYIVGNLILGDLTKDKVGGVSVSSLLGNPNHAVISGNIIRENRYGITMAGANCRGAFNNNIIEDNTGETNPMNGGSGISINAASPSLFVTASGNQIRRNLWGITVIGEASINLGDTAAANFNPGGNIFAENGNGGVTYALYNNTELTIQAMNNCWIEDSLSDTVEVESVIFHAADDTTLGEVVFAPFDCAFIGDTSTVSIPSLADGKLQLFPNPASDVITVKSGMPLTLEIYTLSGQLVSLHEMKKGSNTVLLPLRSGMYVVRAYNATHSFVERLVIR